MINSIQDLIQDLVDSGHPREQLSLTITVHGHAAQQRLRQTIHKEAEALGFYPTKAQWKNSMVLKILGVPVSLRAIL